MGGGIRGRRRSYAGGGGTGENHTLDSQGNEEPRKRVFISFHMDDEAQVELLRQQAKNERSDLEFIDYSIKEPFDEKWKTQATERIRQSSAFICMIGPETHRREAVIWEINKAHELGKKIIGVRIYRDQNHKVPEPLSRIGARIIDWNLKDIASELNEDE